MRSSMVGLQLLLACVLVWGTTVVEEKKECCGPGVPPEKSCCPKENSTSQKPEKEEEQQVVPEEPNSEEPKKQKKTLRVPEERTSEELEENGKTYREIMQKDSRSQFESMFLKEQALDYFNKRKTGAFYRPIEDTDVKVKSATGTIVTFTQFLAKTNCTKEEGRKFSIPWYEHPSTESVPCVALPKHEQKRLKCRVSMFLDATSGRSAMLWHKCEPVVFVDGSEDLFEELDLDHLTDSSAGQFGPSF